MKNSAIGQYMVCLFVPCLTQSFLLILFFSRFFCFFFLTSYPCENVATSTGWDTKCSSPLDHLGVYYNGIDHDILELFPYQSRVYVSQNM